MAITEIALVRPFQYTRDNQVFEITKVLFEPDGTSIVHSALVPKIPTDEDAKRRPPCKVKSNVPGGWRAGFKLLAVVAAKRKKVYVVMHMDDGDIAIVDDCVLDDPEEPGVVPYFPSQSDIGSHLLFRNPHGQTHGRWTMGILSSISELDRFPYLAKVGERTIPFMHCGRGVVGL